MNTDYDVVVVGGSFSGLVFARVAALRGLRVLVLDHRSAPGARVHTTGILVKEAAEALDVPRALTRKIPGVRLYAPGGAELEICQPGHYFLATNTRGLLAWLAREASDAGAELSFATRFHGATRIDGARALRVLGSDVTTRYLIGADGAHSRVARTFGLGSNRRFLIGVEAEFPIDDRVEPDRLHCFIDRTLAPGYLAWIVPGVDIVQVGLARGFPGRPDLRALLRRVAPVADFRDTRPIGWRAGTIPVSGPLRRFATHRVMLLGDAAGWVSPLTGGGIANAFHFARRAAQALSDHLHDDGPQPHAVLARELPRYRAKTVLRWAADRLASNAVTDRMLGSLIGAPIAREIFFHPRVGARPEPKRRKQPPLGARRLVR